MSRISITLHRWIKVTPDGISPDELTRLEKLLTRRIASCRDMDATFLVFAESEHYRTLLRDRGNLTGATLKAEQQADRQLRRLAAKFFGRVRFITALTLAPVFQRFLELAPQHAENLERLLAHGYDRSKITRYITTIRGRDDEYHLLCDDDVACSASSIRAVVERCREIRRDGARISMASGRYSNAETYDKFLRGNVSRDDWAAGVNGFSTRIVQIADREETYRLLEIARSTGDFSEEHLGNYQAPLDLPEAARFLGGLHATAPCALTSPISGAASSIGREACAIGLRSCFRKYTMYVDDALLAEHASAVLGPHTVAEQVPHAVFPQSRHTSPPTLRDARWSLRTYLNQRLWVGAVTGLLFRGGAFRQLLLQRSTEQDLRPLWRAARTGLREFVNYCGAFESTLLGLWVDGNDPDGLFREAGFMDDTFAPHGMRQAVNQLPDTLPAQPAAGTLAADLLMLVEDVALLASKTNADFWAALGETVVDMDLEMFDLDTRPTKVALGDVK